MFQVQHHIKIFGDQLPETPIPHRSWNIHRYCEEWWPQLLIICCLSGKKYYRVKFGSSADSDNPNIVERDITIRGSAEPLLSNRSNFPRFQAQPIYNQSTAPKKWCIWKTNLISRTLWCSNLLTLSSKKSRECQQRAKSCPTLINTRFSTRKRHREYSRRDSSRNAVIGS